MSIDLPEISVLLPVYKGLPLLKNSVESILSQKNIDFEFLIGNDSPDDLETIEYLNSIIDDRVKVIHHSKNKGLFGNLNTLVTESSAKIIHLWSQDDVMLNNCLRKTVDFHNEFSNVCFVFSKVVYINGNSEVIDQQKIGKEEQVSPREHALMSFIAGSVPGNIANVSIPRTTFDEYGLFNEELKYCGDFEYWTRVSVEKSIGVIQEYLINLRRHEGQLSRNPKMWIHRIKENDEILKNIKKRLSGVSSRLLNRALLWRIYNQYFGQYVLLKRKGLKKEAGLIKVELIKKSSWLSYWFRYVVLKFFGIFNLQRWFLNTLYYNKITK